MKTLALAVLALGLMAAPSLALDNLGGGKRSGDGPGCIPGQPVPASTSGALCPTCSEQKAS